MEASAPCSQASAVNQVHEPTTIVSDPDLSPCEGEYLLLPPRSALEAASARLTSEPSSQPPYPPTQQKISNIFSGDIGVILKKYGDNKTSMGSVDFDGDVIYYYFMMLEKRSEELVGIFQAIAEKNKVKYLEHKKLPLQ